MHGIRFLYSIALTWLLFVFINVPLFLIGLLLFDFYDRRLVGSILCSSVSWVSVPSSDFDPQRRSHVLCVVISCDPILFHDGL